MNVAYFLLPKHQVVCCYEDNTFRQGLEKMKHHGYSAIPVLSRSGKYLGTVSEGDFLWKLLEGDEQFPELPRSMKDLEGLRIRDILQTRTYRSVRITVTMEELLERAMNQNFVPVVDDLDQFIGIVTRKDIITHFANPGALPRFKRSSAPLVGANA